MKRAPATLLLALVLMIAAGGVWFLTRKDAGTDGPVGLRVGGLQPGGSEQSSNQPGADMAELASSSSEASRVGGAAAVEQGTRRASVGSWRPPATARWIEGRVESEGGLPIDEEMFVLAEGRRFSSDPDSPDTYRAKVESDGSFRAAFSPETRRGRLLLRGRYAFLDKPEVIKPHSMEKGEEVVLNVELGGRILVEVLPPKSAAFSEDALDGLSVEARVSGWSRVAPLEGKRTGPATFELGGAKPKQAYNVGAMSPIHANAFVKNVKAEPGRTVNVQVELTRGARLAGLVRDTKGEPLLRGKVLAMSHDEARQRNPFFNLGKSEEVEIQAGRFELVGVPPGETMLVVEADGFLEFQEDLGELFDGDERAALTLTASRGGIISGTVVWPDGAPAVGAEVRVAQSDAMGNFDFERVLDSQRVGADGAFEFSALKEGECALTATCIERGWEIPEDASLAERKFGAKAPTWRVHEENVAPGRANLALELEPGSNISGTVVDDAGEPIEAFRIIATPSDVGFLSSNGVRSVKERFDNEKGQYVVEGLMAGKWTLKAQATGYGTGNEREVRAPFDGEVKLTLPRAATIEGLVRSPDGGLLKDANVQVTHGDERQRRVEVDKEGAFKVSKVDPGEVTLVASADGYAKSLPTVFGVGADAERKDLVLELRLGARIDGQLHKGIANRSDRSVRLEGPSGRRESTDSDGGFSFTGLEPGDYKVILTADTKGADGRTRWMLSQANQRTLELSLTAGQATSIILGVPGPSAVRVVGQIFDEGEPVPSALVMVYSSAKGAGGDSVGAAQADSDGSFSLQLDEPGDYRFEVGREMGKLSSIELEVPAGEEFRHDFELPGGRLMGKVTGPDGRPLADVYLTLSSDGARSSGRPWMRSQQTRSLEGGKYVFEDLGAGTYNLRVATFRSRRDLGNMIVRQVVVGEDGTTNKDIQMVLGGTVEGQVVNSSGDGVSDATIWVETEDGLRVVEFGRNRSAAGGIFRAGSVAAGDAWVRAEKGGRKGEPVKVRVSAGGVTSANLTIPD